MSIVELVMRFRAFLNRRTVEREMADEMRFHLEMEVEKHVRSGLSPAAARRAAALAFGGVDRHQEAIRDHRGGRWLEDIGRDLRFALRTLARNPGFALAAALTLALAIGINSMVFTTVNGLLLRPFQVPRPEELVALWGVDERDQGATELGYEDYVDWRDRSGLFTSLAARQDAPLSFTNGTAEILWSELVTGNYFTVLGLKPELGRFFVAGEEARAGASPYVVLSYDLWQRRFGGDPQVVGRKITIAQQPVEVIGVAPKSFHGIRRFGFWPDLWLPIGAPGTEDLLQGRGSGSLIVFGRLRPGLDRERADAQARAFARSLSEAYPESNRDVGAMLTSAQTPFDSPRFVPPRVLVFASTLGLVGVSLILLIACANVANLLLARASARRREIAVRLSIGGSRGRIVRQLLTESALLALIGGLGGLALSLLSTRMTSTMVPQLQFRVGVDLPIDHRVVLFTILLAFAAVFFFGLAPALQATRLNLVGALRNDTATGRRHSRLPELRSVLVGAQIAMSIVLLVAGSLFLRSLNATRGVDFGFETTNRLYLSANPGATGYDAARAASFYREVSRRVQQEPDVISVSWGYPVPFDTNDRGVEVHVAGATGSGERQTMPLPLSTIEPGYFETMSMPILAGRDFTLRDTLGAPRVMIVNRTAAERFWPGRNAIGQRVQLGGPGGPAVEVVGVAERAVSFSPTETPRPFAYFPVQQHSSDGLTLVVHTRRAPAPMIQRLREIIGSVDPQVATYGGITMDRAVRNALNNQTTAASISTTLAVFALILATVGLYGVVAYAVERRTREIGIRIALGARPASVVRLVIGQITRTTLIGVGVGLIGAFVVGRAVSSLLHGVSPTDPLTFVGIPLLLTAVALLASYVPARRATRVHPMIALRRE